MKKIQIMRVVAIFFALFSVTKVWSTDDIDNIQNQLATTAWFPIETKDFVKINSHVWEGKEDLSFAYKLHVREGNIYSNPKSVVVPNTNQTLWSPR